MAEGVWRIAEVDPARPAIVEAAGATITYAQLAERANRLTHGLRARGVHTGDVVAAVLPNQVAMLELQLAAFQAGFYLVPINTRLTAPEIAYILADSGARAVVCADRFAEAAGQALRSLGTTPAAFMTGDATAAPGFEPYEALIADSPAIRPDGRTAGATMHYTSGTTGRPKGVRRPLSGMDPDEQAERLPGFFAIFGIAPHANGVHLAVSPLYHTAVMTFTTTSLHAGHTAVLMDGWSPEETLRLIAEHRVTTSHMVPTQFHRLLNLPDVVRAAADTTSLTHVIHAAAPCPIDVKRRMLAWWGPVIYEYYAATEGGGTMVTPQEWLERPGTVGRPWPGYEVRIANDDGADCPPGEAGTVWMSFGAGDFEYHGDAEKTRAGRRDGFFTVGDVGYLDDAGYLFLCDRKADMIISGGVNIYPAEIESALFAHPKVGDAAVFGIPDSEWGEQVKAVVEPAAGVAPTPELAEELIEFCRRRLAGYKCPRTIDFIEVMPREPTGKLLKRKLRDPYWAAERRAI
ncbi:MAG TPA: acyl-CoA synthetase [Candidatus Dormibacteraeota bacterium]|nr:acyl-CoA synthetase [Candidatus Dormibacteraeota bacterium]